MHLVIVVWFRLWKKLVVVVFIVLVVVKKLVVFLVLVGLFRSLGCLRRRRETSGSTGNVVEEVGKLGRVKRVVIGRVELDVGWVIRGVVIAVIFVVVDYVVRSPFDDETTVL